MRKIAINVLLSGLGICCMASAFSEDTSASLNITGVVQEANAGCTIELDRNYMPLGAQDIKDLPMQGHYKDSVSGTTNVVRMSGDNCKNSGGGSIALKFTGTADSSLGNSFENSSTGTDAAQGIGVGVYGYGKNTIIPNVSDVPTLSNDYLFYVGMVKLYDTPSSPGLVQSTITIEVDRL
ncbi:TPA: fimbrial protein [Citrobacter amalonaticus]|nr:fimbrial protein [Citrobacter amalonaticus]